MSVKSPSSPAANRRGAALLLVLVMTTALAALALSAIWLMSSSALLGRSFNRERDLRYAAEAGLAMGKSRLNNDPYALPDSLYTVLQADAPIVGADGAVLPGYTLSIYAAPTGSTTGQFGRFASVVAVASDAAGPRLVRRLELAQENFSKYAYWTNTETTTAGGIIYFANGDNLWGPVWSNDILNIHTSGATFHDDVGTAKTIAGSGNGTFHRGYEENQKPITLPSNASLAKLQGFAAAGGFAFVAPTGGNETTVRLRIEFVNVDLDLNGTATGADEGFFRVYQANAGETAWLRGDYNTDITQARNCGVYHTQAGERLFYPASVHSSAWFRAIYGNTHGNASLSAIMNPAVATTTPQCLTGGDPRLVAIERSGVPSQKGGSDTTFTAVGTRGSWLPWTGTVDPRLIAGPARRPDAMYLFPLYRGTNTGTKGVIHVNGTVAVSGVLRGRVTIYATGNVVILDDMRYASDPGSAGFNCSDILGIISGNDIAVADNAINTPPNVAGTTYRNVDDTKDLYIHGVLMALNESFRVLKYNVGPSDVYDCSGVNSGRGCLYLTGGLIQQRRGAVGQTNGNGFIKRYSYDRCANYNPPPYFPTTGRFLDNRYYELDPVRFDIAAIFQLLTPMY
jgi:hypothetical protein